jgi:hypothetical protein
MRGRVPDPTDEYAPKELLAKKDADHRQRVEGERAALKQLKEETKRERAALESFIVKDVNMASPGSKPPPTSRPAPAPPPRPAWPSVVRSPGSDRRRGAAVRVRRSLR